MARLFFLAALLAVGYAKPKEDERACEGARALVLLPVSYTHLTLPTIYSV